MADDELIERLARSLCREAGLDPDAASAALDASALDAECVAGVSTAPAWMAYVARAQAHVTAARALRLI